MTGANGGGRRWPSWMGSSTAQWMPWVRWPRRRSLPWGGAEACVDAYEAAIRAATDAQLERRSRDRRRADPLARRIVGGGDARRRRHPALQRALDPGRVTSGTVTGLDARTRLYWESAGTGDPVLLIHGLGLSGGAWWRTVDALAPSMRVITFDHRGIGQSASLTYAYTTEAMADDAVSILDALDIDRLHVYGFSLGGMVAQQVALAPPRASPVPRPGRDAFRRPADEPSGPRGHGVLPAARPDGARGGRVGIGAVQLRTAHPGRTGRSDRRGHRAQAPEPIQRARLPGAATRGVAAQLLRPSRTDQRAHPRRSRRAGSDHPGRQRPHDRGAGAREPS